MIFKYKSFFLQVYKWIFCVVWNIIKDKFKWENFKSKLFIYLNVKKKVKCTLARLVSIEKVSFG